MSFTGGSRTLPQTERDIAPQIRALQSVISAMERRDAAKRAAAADCDEACRERRALELLPVARRFLSSLSEKVARGLKERREEGLALAVRGISNALGEATKKRAVFGSPLAAIMKEEMERGVIKEGLNSDDRRPALREVVAEKGLKAAMSLRSIVQKRTMAKRGQDAEMREVNALITDLESQSQKRTMEAERLGMRAIGDLNDAMKLEKRADHVRHFVVKQKAKRALEKITKGLERRELEHEESKRSDIFGNLKSLATRALQTASLVRKSFPEDLQKRELAGRRIAKEIAQAKRSLDEQRGEKARELVHMKIAEEVAQAKRSLDERRAVKELAQRKIAEGVATAKRVFEKREFAEFAEHERRALKARELAQMNIAESIAKAKRTLEKREFAEKEEKVRALKTIAEGVAKAKRAFEKREFQEKEEQVRKIAEGVEKAKRAFVERAMEERSLAEKRFSDSIDTIKRVAQEAKSKRALETLQTFKRTMEEESKHQQAVRALEGLKTALEKRELGVRALKEEESVRAVRNIGQALEEALSKRALEASKRKQDLRELEAMLADD